MKWRKVFYLDVILPDWVNDNIERGLTEAVDKYEKQEEEEGLKSVSQKKRNSRSLSRSPLHLFPLYIKQMYSMLLIELIYRFSCSCNEQYTTSEWKTCSNGTNSRLP